MSNHGDEERGVDTADMVENQGPMTIEVMCTGCKHYWERKGRCTVFEQDAGPTERTIRLYRLQPPECSAHEHSSGSNFQFLRSIHHTLQVTNLRSCKQDVYKRLRKLANAVDATGYTDEKLLTMALKAQNIERDLFS